MNLLELILKQMRQRALGTWLTLLSVALAVALAVAVLLVRKGGQSLFAQTNYGYDLIIGKGSPLQLVLNTIYHIDQSPGNIPYWLYEQMISERRRQVKVAIPIAVGDYFQRHRVVATIPRFFGFADDGQPLPLENSFQYTPGKRFDITQGRVFHPKKFEAVIGSEVPASTGLKIGDSFQVTHGSSRGGDDDVHAEKWRVVGVMRQTHTANDRVVFIPLITSFAIPEHEEGMREQSAIREHESATAHDDHDEAEDAEHEEHGDHEDGERAHEEHEHDEHYITHPDGTIDPLLPEKNWQISAIIVKARAEFMATDLMYDINAGSVAIAASPGMVMSEFFSTVLHGSTLVLLLISFLVTIVAAVGILVSIYNSVSARKREIAILRALGATRGKVLTLICLEAALIGLLGGVIGGLAGHLVGALGSKYMDRLLGQGFNWIEVSREELLYLAGVVLISLLAGLVPALKAYRTPVANNLTSG